MDQHEQKQAIDDLPDRRRLKSMLKKKTPFIWLFSGDSITAGVRHTHGHRSYPEIMAESIKHDLGRASDLVINAGVNGYSTSDMLEHFSWNIEQSAPAVVSLMIGTNDCASNRKIAPRVFHENLQLLVERIRGTGAIPILHTPNFIIKEKAPERASMEDYVVAIRLVANSNGVILIDHWAYWQLLFNNPLKASPVNWLDDPIHPNSEGHKELASLMYKELFLE